MMIILTIVVLLVGFSSLGSGASIAAESKRLPEWDKALEDAKTEGKIVLAIPPATELRTALEPLLKQKFGIEADMYNTENGDGLGATGDFDVSGAWPAQEPWGAGPDPIRTCARLVRFSHKPAKLCT